MQSIFRSFLVFLTLLLPLSAYAHNRVVVVPMSGDDIEPLSNIVTVAKSNGDFSNPLAAVASITDASASNPYLIVIAPGVYDLGGQLVMKEFVSIAGSGKNITTLAGNVSTNRSDTAGLVIAADNVSIRDLKIVNNGTDGLSSTGIFSSGSNMELSNVEIDANNRSAAAIFGQMGCSFELDNVDINMPRRSSVSELGIALSDCSLNMLGGSIDIRGDDQGRTDFVTGVTIAQPRGVAISNVDMNISGANAPGHRAIGFELIGTTNADREFPFIRISNVSLRVSSGGTAFGVQFLSGFGTGLTIDSTVIDVFASADAQGYSSADTNTIMSDSFILVDSGSGVARGISRFAGSSLLTSFSVLSTSVFVTGAIGIENQGSESNLPMIVRDSRIRAGTSIQAQGIASTNRTYVSDSIISGDVVGQPLCDFVFTTSGERLGNTCEVPQAQ